VEGGRAGRRDRPGRDRHGAVPARHQPDAGIEGAGIGDLTTVGPIRAGEELELFELFARIVAAKEGYPQAPPLTRDVFDETWLTHATVVVVARCEGAVAGAYYLKPNQPGRAAHIANAGYVVDRPHRGRGIGRLLVEDSITRAPAVGFDAIQFNLVFESNPARRLYEDLGWEQIGRVPNAVDGEAAIIYWRAV
jgi:GNAT superfamily N-acetyltransferase